MQNPVDNEKPGRKRCWSIVDRTKPNGNGCSVHMPSYGSPTHGERRYAWAIMRCELHTRTPTGQARMHLRWARPHAGPCAHGRLAVSWRPLIQWALWRPVGHTSLRTDFLSCVSPLSELFLDCSWAHWTLFVAYFILELSWIKSRGIFLNKH